LVFGTIIFDEPRMLLPFPAVLFVWFSMSFTIKARLWLFFDVADDDELEAPRGHAVPLPKPEEFITS